MSGSRTSCAGSTAGTARWISYPVGDVGRGEGQAACLRPRHPADRRSLTGASAAYHEYGGQERGYSSLRRVPERGQESRRRVRAKGLSFVARRHSGMSSPPSCFSLPADAYTK
jgi:hypothetical protein